VSRRRARQRVAYWPRATGPVADSPQAVTRTVQPSGSGGPSTTAGTDTAPPATPSAGSPTTSIPEESLPGVPVKPDDVAVESVTAVRSGSFWVLGTGRCPQGACKVIAHTTDEGATFSFRTGPDPGEPTRTPGPAGLAEPPGAIDLRYAVTGDDAWGFGEEVWATHDAGRTWAPVAFPVPVAVSSIQAWNDRVWAFGTATTDGAPVVLSSPVAEDQWSEAHVGLASTDRLAAPGVADGVVGAMVTHADGLQEYVRSRDGGSTWEAVPAPSGCETPLSSSGVEGAVWLHCSSAAGAVLAVTTDGGDTWSEQSLPPPSSGLTTMTGIDSEHALVTDATTLSIVAVASDGGAVQQVPGPYTASDDVWADASGYTYAGFTDPSTGYLITSGGALARSEDGGHHWKPVELP
jgi:photosystem II stability/assembly factor-like uncharacterized protein